MTIHLLVCLLVLIFPLLGLKKGEKATSHIVMDMAPDSFDDQYQGCREQVREELDRGDYFQKELGSNKNYSSIWEKAKLVWSKKPRALLREMQENHAVALMAYTMNTSLHSDLNWAVSRAGRSPEHYKHSFPFKYLHFYLTTAVQLVRRWKSGTSRRKCYQVHRGVKSLYFEAEIGTKVRFGRFTSTSLLRKEAQRFGNETIFTLTTCSGAVVQDFSHYFSEREVLIPPYEIFQVRNFSRTPSGNRLYLRSVGNYSQYNCQLLKASSSKNCIHNTPVAAFLSCVICAFFYSMILSLITEGFTCCVNQSEL